MSADGTPVKSVLEATRAELEELSRYAERLEAELRAANLRASKAEAYAASCKQIAQGMLWARQLEIAATYELLDDLAKRPLDARDRKLVYNVRQALRSS